MIEHPTIPQLARSLPRPVPRRTMFRRLLALHAGDRHGSTPDWVPWLFRYEGGPWRVNVSRLRRAHPELFEVSSPEELERRIGRVERQIEVLDAGHRALVTRVKAAAVR